MPPFWCRCGLAGGLFFLSWWRPQASRVRWCPSGRQPAVGCLWLKGSLCVLRSWLCLLFLSLNCLVVDSCGACPPTGCLPSKGVAVEIQGESRKCRCFALGTPGTELCSQGGSDSISPVIGRHQLMQACRKCGTGRPVAQLSRVYGRHRSERNSPLTFEAPTPIPHPALRTRVLGKFPGHMVFLGSTLGFIRIANFSLFLVDAQKVFGCSC